MKSQLYISILILFFATKISNGFSSRIYIWNVGQGQWVTWVHENECLHFDMGGEFAALRRIRQLCQFRKNILYLSHSDFDHIRYIFWGAKNLANLCLFAKSRETLNARKSSLIQSINICPKQNTTRVEEVHFNSKSFKNSNDLSRVFLLNGVRRTILIPGDSTSISEKIWVPQIKPRIKRQIYGLVLGHHGSKTSTGPYLIQNLHELTLAFASARKKRYGHPHPVVQMRLKNNGVSLNTTEIWGNLVLELK